VPSCLQLRSEIKKEGLVLVYPNPTSEFLNIDLSGLKDVRKFEIYNTLGQLVLSEKISSPQNAVDVRPFVPDVYFLRVIGSNTSFIQLGL
jgi:lysyl endopeptidase